MAIAFDNSSSGSGVGSSTFSWNHTCAGSNRILLIGIFWRKTSAQTLNSVTYNGVAMTQIGTDINNGLSNINYSVFYIIAPAVGPNTILATWSASIIIFSGVSLSYTGVKQTGQPDSFNNGFNSNSTITVATNVVGSGCWGIGFCTSDAGLGVSTLTSDKTDRVLVTNNYNRGSDTNGIIGTGSQSIQFTQDGSASSRLNLAFYISISPVEAIMMVDAGSFILTGINILFRSNIWTRTTKHSSNYSNRSKSNSSWTKRIKS